MPRIEWRTLPWLLMMMRIAGWISGPSRIPLIHSVHLCRQSISLSPKTIDGGRTAATGKSGPCLDGYETTLIGLP